MNKEIIIDFSNNITIIFKSVSYATAFITNLYYEGIVAEALHCSDTVDYKFLQEYIEGLDKSIKYIGD